MNQQKAFFKAITTMVVVFFILFIGAGVAVEQKDEGVLLLACIIGSACLVVSAAIAAYILKKGI